MTDTLSLSMQTIQDIQNATTAIGLKDWFNIIFLFVNAAILCATIYVIRKSPSDAVKIGRELNEAQIKDEAKVNLFFTLFSYRGSPVHRHFVDALNRIDIVFYDTPKVLSAWHKLFDSLHQTNLVNQEDTWRLLRTELLSEISLSLGYKDLKQYDIEKHYFPQGHENQQAQDWEFRYDQHEYYKISKDLHKLLFDFYTSGVLPPTPPTEE